MMRLRDLGVIPLLILVNVCMGQIMKTNNTQNSDLNELENIFRPYVPMMPMDSMAQRNSQMEFKAMNPKMPPDICKYQMDHGPCSAVLPRFFYDVITKECVKFIYGGCPGNPNNFLTKEECKSVCSNLNELENNLRPYVRMMSVDSMTQRHSQMEFKAMNPKMPPDICNLPMNHGPCFDVLLRFYYDVITKKCVHFIYGGCHGNPNNFVTKEDCESVCKIHTVEESPGNILPHNKNSPGLHDKVYYRRSRKRRQGRNRVPNVVRSEVRFGPNTRRPRDRLAITNYPPMRGPERFGGYLSRGRAPGAARRAPGCHSRHQDRPHRYYVGREPEPPFAGKWFYD